MTKRPTPSWWLFWAAAGLAAYTYAGFPLLTLLRGRLWPRPFRQAPVTPHVSFIVAAHNEAAVIRAKIDNALGLDYPADRLEIVVASDGSDDGTDAIAAAIDDPRVRLLALPRGGKNRTVNAAVAASSGEILVFTDADSLLAPDALRRLIAPFADPGVGGVAGDYRYAADGQDGVGERAYWSFDRLLKESQSRSASVTSATGQIYAIRRALFRPVPSGVTDDAYISRHVVGQGKRLVFAPGAIARGPIADADGEFRRKVRISTRGLSTVRAQAHLLDPRRYGAYAVQLLTHKVLRRLMAVPLFVMAVTAPRLWRRGPFYRLAALGQGGFYALAAAGYLLRHQSLGRRRWLSLPFHFVMVNAASALGLLNVVRGQRFDVWQAERGGDGAAAKGAP